jgi:hypothetical protein
VVRLIKRRPEIALFAPKDIATGSPFRVRTVLACEETLPVDAVTMELLGEGVWTSTSQYGNHRESVPFSRHVAHVVQERRELDTGTHELEGVFELPADAPSSYLGENLRIEWSVRVHVDIPWWPDARAIFPLWVWGRPSPITEDPQRVFASNTGGPQGRKPYAEISLGSTRLQPGGRLLGRAALGNTASNAYRSLRFALVGVERLPSLLGARVLHNRVANWTVPVHAPRDDDPMDFSLHLPSNLVPGFRTRELGLEWFLEVRLDVAWSIDTKLWIPVTVQSWQTASTQESQRPLAVGSERLALLWADAARQTGFNYVDTELTREVGVCRLNLRREQARRGLRLVAEARFPDVDLGLRHARGRLRVRDERQSRILAEQTDPAAAACGVVHADDERIRCELDDAGTRLETLVAFARCFEQLVRAFETTRAELPAPADVHDLVPQFRAAARRLGGELDLASMNVRGHREELPFSLETQWDDDGTLARTVLIVRPLVPVDGRHHCSWQPADGLEALSLPLAPLVEGARGVVVDERSLQIVFPPRPENLDDLVGRLEGLIEIGLRLSGRRTGYR